MEWQYIALGVLLVLALHLFLDFIGFYNLVNTGLHLFARRRDKV